MRVPRSPGCDARRVLASDESVCAAAEPARTSPPNWAGDVLRIGPALAANVQTSDFDGRHRADRDICSSPQLRPIEPRVHERLDDIVREYVQPDPQPVPREILARTGALHPEDALSLELWDELREVRN